MPKPYKGDQVSVSENHPWRKKMGINRSNQQSLGKAPNKAKKPIWSCPQCGDALCSFGECVV